MTQSVGDFLMRWLFDHPHLNPYVTVSYSSNTPTKSVSLRTSLCLELASLYRTAIDRESPQLLPPHRCPRHLGGRASLAFHRRYFIKTELRRLQRLRLDSLSLAIADLTELLNGDISPDFEILINTEKLMTQTFVDTFEMAALRSHSKALKKVLLNSIVDLSNFPSQRTLICEVLSSSTDIFDNESAFLQPSPLQDRLEMLFEYDKCPISKVLSDLVESDNAITHHEFFEKILTAVRWIIQTYELPIQLDNVLFAMTFRYTFEKLYGLQKSSLMNIQIDKEIQRIALFAKAATFKKLDPPKQYCPPHNPDSLIAEVFRESAEYREAVETLGWIRFYTNPIDILNVVSESLNQIIVGVSAINGDHDIMLPFEVTFGLFLCVWITADVPELKWSSKFVAEYLPPVMHERLNQAFQYANTKLTAVVSYMPKILGQT
jgi:hypothetical protein